jgi:REP element-mobilizing transposase RayT
MNPYYTPHNVKAAYVLRYDWTGWPSSPPLPAEPDDDFFRRLSSEWETDGIRLLERQWSQSDTKILASVTPRVSPVVFTGRIKGRLQYHLRKADTPVKFSRKVSFRTLGENDQKTVEKYIARQVDNEDFADPEFADYLRRFTVLNEHADLSVPFWTNSGRYWYLLHLVLVMRNRMRIVDEDWLTTLRDGCFRIARARGHELDITSVMPDHLHLALRGHIEQSPETIALCYMNNLSHFLDRDALFQPSYYVGSFGAYSLGAIRKLLGLQTPAGFARKVNQIGS